MRRFILISLLIVAGLGWTVLNAVGSSMALADIGGRPIIALTRPGQEVAVQTPGQAAKEGEARVLRGEGVAFGYRFFYALPGGATVACTIRFRSLVCSDGWTAGRGIFP